MEYKSKCRFPLLIALEGEIRQIRPGEIVVISESISHPYLELITVPIKKKVKKESVEEVMDALEELGVIKQPDRDVCGDNFADDWFTSFWINLPDWENQ